MLVRRSMWIVGSCCVFMGAAVFIVCVTSWGNNSLPANLISGGVGIALFAVGAWILTEKLRKKEAAAQGQEEEIQEGKCMFILEDADRVTEVNSFSQLEEAVRRGAGCAQSGITLQIRPSMHGITLMKITPKRNEKGYCRVTLLRELPKGTQYWMKQFFNADETVEIFRDIYVKSAMPDMTGWTDFSKEYRKGTVESKFKLMDDYFYQSLSS